MAGLNCWGR